MTSLVEAGELAEVPGSVVVLDVRWRLGGPPGRDDYLRGHIPSAVFIDLDTDLAGPPGVAGRHPMPTAAVFEAAMRRAGVSADRVVVVYDDADSMAASRAWWLLRYFGHEDVRVLNGGFRAWAGSVTAEVPVVVPGDFHAKAGHLPLLDADAAAALGETGLLLDARAGERYRGEVEPIDAKAGHIPGAVSAPSADNVNSDGTFRDPAALASRFRLLGAGPGVQAGVYCGSGVTAAHEVLAMHLAGLQAALYVGSWSEWITDPTRPIATG